MEQQQPSQEITWRDLGYDRFMRRPRQTEMRTFTSDDVDLMFEDGSISSRHVKSLVAGQILTSILEARLDVGSGSAGTFVRLDGPNNRIIINDGTHDRVLIGYQKNGF